MLVDKTRTRIVSCFMKCYFRSFDVGIGDCNVIRLVKDDGTQYVIMVDCGCFTTPVKEYVEIILHNHIDILVATHIDGDHIKGLASMLATSPDLQIDHIWYNCYGRKWNDTDIIELSDDQKEILQWVKNALPVEFDAINYRREISSKQGKTLAGEILVKEEWKNAWRMDEITSQTPDFDLPEGLGKIVFLSPTKDALSAIEKLIKDEFNKRFMQIWNESLNHAESISELLVRLSEAYKEKFETKQISAMTINNPDTAFIKKLAGDEGIDPSDKNYSSIAFMLECGKHKVAMLGDAVSSTLEKSISDKYNKKPIICDAIKVSHHGSNGNSSKALLDLISSHKYFIPGGRKDEYPTWGTLGRIALSNQDGTKKLIVFSHKSDMSNLMDKLDISVKNELNIETIITDKEYELFEW